VQSYEVWDTRTKNLVDYFDDYASALNALRGMASLESLALARRDEATGRTEWLGRGAELERLVDRPAAV